MSTDIQKDTPTLDVVEVLDRTTVLPYEVFVSNEGFELSSEGFIQNIIDWWKRRKKEAYERKKQQNKRDWQMWINRYFDNYVRWLNSVDPKKAKDMEVSGLKFDDWCTIVNATTKIQNVFGGVDPFKYKKLIDMLNDLKRGNTNKIWITDESGVELLKYGKSTVQDFKGSKYDKESEVNRLCKMIIDMDNASWMLIDKGDDIVERWNSQVGNMSNSEFNTRKKLVIGWLNMTNFIISKGTSIEKSIIATLNAV